LCFETGSRYFEIRAPNGKIPLQATPLPFEQTLDKGNNEQAFDVQKFSKAIAPFYPVLNPQPELFLPNSESIIPLDPKDIQHMVKQILRKCSNIEQSTLLGPKVSIWPNKVEGKTVLHYSRNFSQYE